MELCEGVVVTYLEQLRVGLELWRRAAHGEQIVERWRVTVMVAEVVCIVLMIVAVR